MINQDKLFQLLKTGTKLKKKRRNKEDIEHMNFVHWLNKNNIPFNHCPIGGKRPVTYIKGKIVCLEGAKLKRMGTKKGVPDFEIMLANQYHHGLYIEMKKAKGGVLSKEQKKWIEFLIDVGYCAVSCNGYQEAIELTKKYLKTSNMNFITPY